MSILDFLDKPMSELEVKIFLMKLDLKQIQRDIDRLEFLKRLGNEILFDLERDFNQGVENEYWSS